MTRTPLIVLALAGSAGLLAAAFAFEYFGGLLPCVLCWYQRYPHMAALAIGLLAFFIKGPQIPLIAMGCVALSAGIGVFHAGVEIGLWPGLEQCAVNALKGVNPEDLLDMTITLGAPASCDKVPWSLLGLSMAGWNALASTFVAGLWLAAARKG